VFEAFTGADAAWPLAGLAALGAFHGINPGMGWLFAVALGMQERSRGAIWRALAALTGGHALAIAAAIVVAGLARGVISDAVIRALVAGVLVTMGVSRLVRSRHPRAGSMRIGFAGLIGWSFLMASAHGAGLMVLPIVLDAPVHAAAPHAGHLLGTESAGASEIVAATLVHAAAYLAVTAAMAWLVYEKLGLALLRRAWINLDVIWAAALIVTGALAVLSS
jgi:hypothetical protein